MLFVSRDGYILQKIYQLLAANDGVENHYIYAPRILNIKCFLDYRNNFSYLKNLFELNKDICSDFNTIPVSLEKGKQIFNKNIKTIQKRANENFNEYKKYIDNLQIKNTRIATVDMTTGAFSSQAFLTEFFKEKIILGLFSGTFAESSEFKYKTFINKKFTAEDITKVNILELLFTAPELPLEDLKNSKPIYKTPTKNDLYRLELFPEIEKGIFDFVNTYKEIFGKYMPIITSETAVDLLEIITTMHSKEDKYYLKQVSHSKDINNKTFRAIYSDLRLPINVKRKVKSFIIKSKKQFRLFLRDKYKLVKFHIYETWENIKC